MRVNDTYQACDSMTREQVMRSQTIMIRNMPMYLAIGKEVLTHPPHGVGGNQCCLHEHNTPIFPFALRLETGK